MPKLGDTGFVLAVAMLPTGWLLCLHTLDILYMLDISLLPDCTACILGAPALHDIDAIRPLGRTWLNKLCHALFVDVLVVALSLSTPLVQSVPPVRSCLEPFPKQSTFRHWCGGGRQSAYPTADTAKCW